MRSLIGILIVTFVLLVPTGEPSARSRPSGVRKHRVKSKRHRATPRRRTRRTRRCRRRGDLLMKLKYLHGGAVWIPAEARCGGSYPVVVMLHGNNTSKDKVVSLGGGRNLERWARRYMNGRLIEPVILAEPIHFAACAPASRRKGLGFLFARPFDFGRYRKLLEAKLKKVGVRAKSWSFIGHSGAACCLGMGLFALKKTWPSIKVWASADGCYNGQAQSSTVIKLFAQTKTRVYNACRGYPSYKGYKKYERSLLTRKSVVVRCDKRYYKTCRRHPSKPWFSYVTRFTSPRDHSKVLIELFKTVVFHQFPSARRVAIRKRREARRRRLAKRRRQRARRRRLAARRRARRRRLARRKRPTRRLRKTVRPRPRRMGRSVAVRDE